MTTGMNIEMRRRLLRIISSPELIADAVHCLEIKRLIRIGFDFLPQVDQGKVYGAVKAIEVQAKDTFHRFQAPKRPARGAGKRYEQLDVVSVEMTGFPS